jgi:sodium-dependent dicarboxylate transporter 2/3/5
VAPFPHADMASLFWMMVVFGTLASAMSSIMSNTATANLILPIVMGLALELRAPMLVAVAFCCSLAMPLPISTPPNAMAFASGHIPASSMLRAGSIISVIALVVLLMGYQIVLPMVLGL